jgi:hypothetical protein
MMNISFEDWGSLFSVHHSAFIVYLKGVSLNTTPLPEAPPK